MPDILDGYLICNSNPKIIYIYIYRERERERERFKKNPLSYFAIYKYG